jgi:DNA-binding NarL/FixJ family response regulator
MKPTIRVALSDDHPIVLAGLRELINSEPDMQVVCESRNGLQARAAILEHKPDVAVIDISMPGLNGIALTRQLAEEAPAVRAMLLTLHEDRTYLQEAFNAGARAYILKRSATECLISAIRSVATGAQYVDPALHLAVENTGVVSSAPLLDAALSHREADVLKQTALGLSLKEIASHLAIGIKTVETHKTRAMDKLGLTSRVELMRYAALHGWLSARTAG